MLKEFVVEALDLATNVEEHLLSLERRPNDTDALNALFRSFHTIKGGAGFMNLPAIVSACHLTENLFDGLRTGQVPVTPTAIEAGLQASGFVGDQLKQLANGATPDSLPAMPQSLEDLLTQAIEGKEVVSATETPERRARFRGDRRRDIFRRWPRLGGALSCSRSGRRGVRPLRLRARQSCPGRQGRSCRGCRGETHHRPSQGRQYPYRRDQARRLA